MATNPRSGLYSFTDFETGQNGWADQMVANWARVSNVLTQCRVSDRDLASPPATPSDGDAYIVATSATDDWSGHEDDIAVWSSADDTWVFYTPEVGWVCTILDEEVLSMYKAAGWSAGVSL